MRVARSQVAVAPAVAPKAGPAVAVAVRRPVVAVAVPRPAVAVRPAVVPTAAARKVAVAVGLLAAIPTVAAQTVAEAVGLLAVDLPVVALLAADLPKAVQRAAAGEGARPAPEAARAAARREGVVRGAVRTAVPAVRFWSPLLQEE